jgi:hypothetical protein
MRIRLILIRSLCAASLLMGIAGATTALEAQYVCRDCAEAIDTASHPWAYFHLLYNGGGVKRTCLAGNNLFAALGGSEHNNCHPEPIDGSCSTHGNCIGGGEDLAKIASDAQRLLHRIEATSAFAMTHDLVLFETSVDRETARRLVELPNVVLFGARELRVINCKGDLVSRWALSPRAYWILSAATGTRTARKSDKAS